MFRWKDSLENDFRSMDRWRKMGGKVVFPTAKSIRCWVIYWGRHLPLYIQTHKSLHLRSDKIFWKFGKLTKNFADFAKKIPFHRKGGKWKARRMKKGKSLENLCIRSIHPQFKMEGKWKLFACEKWEWIGREKSANDFARPSIVGRDPQGLASIRVNSGKFLHRKMNSLNDRSFVCCFPWQMFSGRVGGGGKGAQQLFRSCA